MTFWILIGRGNIWVLFFSILIIMEWISFMIKFIIIMYLILSKLYFGHIRFLIASSGVLLATVRGITLFVISFFRLLLFRLRGLIIKLVSVELTHYLSVLRIFVHFHFLSFLLVIFNPTYLLLIFFVKSQCSALKNFHLTEFSRRKLGWKSQKIQ